MDKRKKLTNYGNKKKIYMDLKDIIGEIALRYLPAKSLFQCTGVCREWKHQISTPFFAHNQSICFHSTSDFFYQTQAGEPSFMSLDPMAYGVPDPSLTFLPEPVDIPTSCNGLLCCHGRTGYQAYYICNPVTKQWKKLPKPDADHGPDPALMLLFEPSFLNFIADDKLVCAFPSELGGYEFDIYSSEKGSWRTSGEIYFGDRKLLPKSGVHVNGTVYWLSSQGVIAFDLTSERSPILSFASQGIMNGALGMMNGKLCAAYVLGRSSYVSVLSNTHSNTMRLHSDARTWVKIRSDINLDTSYQFSSRYGHGLGSVVFVSGDMVLLRNGNTFYTYDMKKKAPNSLGEINIDSKACIVGYVNRLVEL